MLVDGVHVPPAPTFADADQVLEVGQAVITFPLASAVLDVPTEVQVGVQVAVCEVRYVVVPVPAGHCLVALGVQVILAPILVAVDQVVETGQAVITFPLASAVLVPAALKFTEQVPA
jgi:hypothetical protein